MQGGLKCGAQSSDCAGYSTHEMRVQEPLVEVLLVGYRRDFHKHYTDDVVIIFECEIRHNCTEKNVFLTEYSLEKNFTK